MLRERYPELDALNEKPYKQQPAEPAAEKATTPRKRSAKATAAAARAAVDHNRPATSL